MTAAAVALPRVVSRTRVADFFFFATFFCVTFEKLQWNVAGTVTLADVLTIAFLVTFALSYRGRVPRAAGILALFLAGFLLVAVVRLALPVTHFS